MLHVAVTWRVGRRDVAFAAHLLAGNSEIDVVVVVVVVCQRVGELAAVLLMWQDLGELGVGRADL